MILSVTLSKPTANVRTALGNDFIRIRIKLLTASTLTEPQYFAELFTKTQVFHKKMDAAALDDFLAAHETTAFRSCVRRTETEEITTLVSKKGKVTRLTKPIQKNAISAQQTMQIGFIPAAKTTHEKNYLLREGVPVPFLIHLGIMTAQGKVIAAKYDKFKQINRFLEYIDDILHTVLANCNKTEPLRVVDFGSGKSYLTFAVHYFLTEIRHIDCEILGLDLKEDVIAYCNRLAQQCECKHLRFAVGDIADYTEEKSPDIVITLHACDTATDYALAYAVRHNATAILTVPCCQHEVNAQLQYTKHTATPFAPLLKYGIIKERFATLVTDALRAEYLEAAGYKVHALEFIDMSHTPKNILLRAIKNRMPDTSAQAKKSTAQHEVQQLTHALGINQMLQSLLAK